MLLRCLLLLFSVTIVNCYDNSTHFKEEKFFKSVRQLTFGGANAEAYFSFDNSKLTFQAMGADYSTGCDQIYQLDLKNPTSSRRRISTGLGVCTCSFFLKDNKHSLYAGTFHNLKLSGVNQTHYDTCPIKHCRRSNKPKELEDICAQKGAYFWDIYEDFDIFVVNEFGNIVSQLTDADGYDAEAVVNPAGDKILFTSKRKWGNEEEFEDLELYLMDIDGKNVERLTNELGYDGGAFFSPDGKKIVFRASRPNTTEEIDTYKKLLKYNLVKPMEMEIFTMDLATREITQVTRLGGANWAPYYLNDNKRIIFSSNHHSQDKGFGSFSLFVINEDGSGLERITFAEGKFDSFPMFSYDGKYLAFGSSRNSSQAHDVNIFLAEWTEKKTSAITTTSFVTLLLGYLFVSLQ